jgi:hypothetical protein
MEPFNPAKAFQQIRAESQRAKEAAEEPSRLKQEAWDAFGRGRVVFQQLMSLFPPENEGCTWDGARAAALMVKYAQTLPAEWVKARVEFVRERLAKLAADGRPVQGADFKGILLNLLLFAHAGDDAKVAETFNEAMRGDANEVGFFRWYLVNWLVDKVVDGCHPLPDELQPLRATSDEALEEEASLDRRVAPTGCGSGDTDGAGPAKNRLRFDPQTQTITLDGTPQKIADPKAFAVYKEIASSCPMPLKQAQLQERVAGCRGTKKIRQLLDDLPKKLRVTVLSGPNGYWLDLDPLPNCCKRRRRKKGCT